MTKKILYVFPDTNLFIQCRSLEEINWLELGEYDEIQVIVLKPVQREIDKFKNSGNDRRGKRARKISTIFREIIISGQGHKLICDANPQVKLILAHKEQYYQANQKLSGELDYTKIDDEIVGCLSSYLSYNPKNDVKLLTHDTGPLGTAQYLGLPFTVIPDEWLMQAESNEIERENNRLRDELAKLKKTEPEFQVTFLNSEHKEITSLQVEYPEYQPLTEEEVSTLIEVLRKKYPLVTDFSLQSPFELKFKILSNALLTQEEPPSNQEILHYTEQLYPAWIKECEQFLRSIHKSLQSSERPYFCFTSTNIGTRPGKDVLVTISAEGKFYIQPPQSHKKTQKNKDPGNNKKGLFTLKFPLPPEVPKRKIRSAFDQYVESAFDAPHLLGMGRNGAFLTRGAVESIQHSSYSRDPNSFFYKEGRPMKPVQSFSLECEQWRHGMNQEHFEGNIFPYDKNITLKGALQFRLHAENLSKPIIKAIPIEIIRKQISAFPQVEKLLNELNK